MMDLNEVKKENKSKLEELKTQYQEELRKLLVENPLNDPGRLDENAIEDDAQEVVDTEISVAAIDSVKEALEEVEDALKRIEEGKYGDCKKCGKEIPLERLKAYPAAGLCIDCEIEDVKSVE